ncbi:MAG: sulfate permease [Rhodocyclaceae bacterium]|nr:sulfate permease [Rhodocyclaceae bacterium]
MNPLTNRLAVFFPFLRWWPLVSQKTLRDDLVAGLTGALIVLPQGVAFALIAGLPPQYGLYAAMVPAAIAALFGSSLHLVTGPTTAISIAIYAALSHVAEPGSPRYIELVLTLTFLVGVFQLLLGLARLGALVNFISHTVVIGFTSGAAILIAVSQARNFFGIDIPRGIPFYEILHQLWLHAHETNPWALSIGLLTLATGLLIKKRAPKVPYMIVAMLVGTLAAEVLNLWLGQETTGIRTVGALPAGLPPLSAPDLSFGALKATVAPALVITMLALTEALSIARAIAVRSEQRLDGNQEFIGQGLSNIVGSFFSSYAASGSFNRSGVNFESGAKTPLSSVFASAFLVIILLAVAPLAAYLPHAAMAGILFLVAWGLIDVHHIAHIWRTSKSEAAILATTFTGTLVNLEAGIFLGVFLSLLMFLYRTSKPELVPVVPAPEEGAYHFVRAQGRPECPQLRILRVTGSLYFGAANYVQQSLQQIDENNPLQKSVLLACSGLSYLDVAGAEVLAAEARRRRRLGGGLYFYRMNQSNMKLLRKGGYLHDIGEGAFFPVMSNVVGALYWTLDPDVCRRCQVRIFKECKHGILPDGWRRQRLLLATDGSEFSHAPEEIALHLAQAFGVTLDVMTMVSPGDSSAAEARLAQVERRALAQGVSIEKIIHQGDDPVAAVIAAARDSDANILIIGRRPPKGGVKERWLGDIAQNILLSSPCHVLIANWQARIPQTRLLIASDASDFSERVLQTAIPIAKALKLPVTLLSVAADAKSHALYDEDIRIKVGLLRLEGIEAEGRIAEGAPADTIVAIARDIKADLVIIGNDQRKGLARKLTSVVTDRVVGQLASAVLIVKPEAEPDALRAAIDKQV